MLYTSTCGGRTENAEESFSASRPYLRGRECAAEGKAALAPLSSRVPRSV